MLQQISNQTWWIFINGQILISTVCPSPSLRLRQLWSVWVIVNVKLLWRGLLVLMFWCLTSAVILVRLSFLDHRRLNAPLCLSLLLYENTNPKSLLWCMYVCMLAPCPWFCSHSGWFMCTVLSGPRMCFCLVNETLMIPHLSTRAHCLGFVVYLLLNNWVRVRWKNAVWLTHIVQHVLVIMTKTAGSQANDASATTMTEVLCC